MASMKAMAAIALTLMVVVPIGLGYALATEKVNYSEWETESTTNISDMLLNHESPFYGDYMGTTNNTTLDRLSMNYVTTGTMPTSYPALTLVTNTITFPANEWVDMSDKGTWSFTLPAFTSITFEDGSMWQYDHGRIIIHNAGQVKISRTLTLEVTSEYPTATFANVSDGWRLPDTQPNEWSNNQSNHSATFTIHQEPNSVITLGLWRFERIGEELTIRFYPGASPTYPSHSLGNYSEYQVTWHYNWDITVDGLNGWPEMDRTPNKFNHLDLYYPIPGTHYGKRDFTTVTLSTNNLSNVFRVDNTTIVMGMYPTTLDKTLDLSAQFPGRSYDLNLTSIGVYGDSITLAGQSFPIENGRITVDGATVPLKGAKISTRPADGHYENAINGHALPDSNAPITVVFGGEWSLTVNADFVRESTGERTQWAAGQFAFDKEDFAACGLLVCAACLLGLGAMGRRSGIKFAFLAFVLGGAALGYLILI